MCAWLRNDLRLHDNPVLHRASLAAGELHLPVLPVYVLDPRDFQKTRHGSLKTGPIRARFLLEFIRVLKNNLRAIGSDLLVRIGLPEEVIPSLLPAGSRVITQEEVTSEEKGVDSRMQQQLASAGVAWEYCWGSTLFHRDDLPYSADLKDMPDVFTHFKNAVAPELRCPCNTV
ncbi:unnamed protein product, partial [Polarella glacialis]